jgi:hypothetical protein
MRPVDRQDASLIPAKDSPKALRLSPTAAVEAQTMVSATLASRTLARQMHVLLAAAQSDE